MVRAAGLASGLRSRDGHRFDASRPVAVAGVSQHERVAHSGTGIGAGPGHSRERPAVKPESSPTESARAALRQDLARAEIGAYVNLTGLAETGEAIRARAEQQGWAHEEARARLVVADALARTDQMGVGAQVERDILGEAMRTGDELLAARAHHLLGTSMDRLGLITEALSHAADGVHLLPPDAPAHLRVVHTMLLALMSSQQLSGDGFRSSFDQVISDAEALPEPDLMLAALNNYAWLLYERGDTQDASAVVQRMQQVAGRSGARLTCASLDTVARVLLDLGELEQAEEVAREAIDPRTPSSGRFSFGEALLTLAEIRRHRGDHADAFVLAEQAQLLAVAHEMPEIRAFALRLKASLLAARGDFRGAYQASIEYHELWETVRSRETDSRAVLLQTVLRTDEARRRSAVWEDLAERDPLTGVWNRRHLERLLPAMLGEHDASGIPLSIAIVDLDRFKTVNDERDHQIGDAALCRIADLLAAETSEPAFTVRLGGDEFLLVLPGRDEPAAYEVAERARHAVADDDWDGVTQGLSVTISVGVATSGSATTHSELLRIADENMYRAKRSGRNTVAGSARRRPRIGPTGTTAD